jgi:hypothetical protein
MALTKMQGFTGEAEILGRLCSVIFQADTLTIEGVDLLFAKRLLDHCGVGVVQVEAMAAERQFAGLAAHVHVDAQVEAAPQKVEHAQVAQALTSSPSQDVLASGVPNIGKHDAPIAAVVAELIFPQLVQDLAKLTKLDQVIAHVHKAGTPLETKAIVAVLAPIKDKVPLLSAIRNLDERVETVLTYCQF